MAAAAQAGLKRRPDATQGAGLADVMACDDPSFQRRDLGARLRTPRCEMDR